MKVIKKNFTKKLWKVMKIGATQGMMALVLCGISIAHSNYAQLLDSEVTINLSNVSLEKALKEIEAVAHVKFVYSLDQLSEEEGVSLKAEKQTLRDVLNELLTPRHISYKVHEKEATITLKKQRDDDNKDQSLLNSGTNGHGTSQVFVTGTVVDATTKQPMAGVNIVIKGTTNGTTTDADGKFSVSAENKDILVFSFIGYAPTEVQVNDKSVISVQLTEDIKNLSEVVVNAGYWDVKEREQTGSIAHVSSDEIQRQPVNNPLQALQGRMTGVYIQQNTGVPGGGFKIQIRGQNSLRTDGNDPLYVVDGVPFTSTSLTSTTIGGSIINDGNPLSAINPADIESIDVLKDADATAIYGSRGANGVVLITTKKSKSGKTTFDVNVYQGIGKVSNTLSLLNTQQHVAMRTQALKNDGYWPLPNYLHPVVPDVFFWDTTRYTNWQKELIGGTANTTNARLSVSGGNTNTHFTLGGGYYRETTVFPGDFNFQRASGNFNLNHTSDNRKFKANVVLNYTSSINNLLPLDLTSIAITLPPNAPSLYDSTGGINWDWKNNTFINPVANLKKKYRSNTDNLIANTSLSYEIFPGLNLKTNLGYTSMQVSELATSPLSAIAPQFLAGQTGSSSFGHNTLKTWIIEPQASYLRQVGPGSLNVVVGTTFQESKQDAETLIAKGYTSDALLENILAATSLEVSGSTYSQYRYSALFGRINYTWQDKYIMNLTARRDGSSRFGPGRRFGNFGAVGVAWIFSNEDFVKNNLPFLSFGKLRSSYGTTGSDAIGNYQYLDTYSSTTYPYNNTSGLVVTRLNNPDYSWETNKKFEVGLEFGLLKDRINVSTSRYSNRSSNQLVGLPLPLLTGQSSVQFNLPATVENTGWEFMLRTTNLNNTKFKWSTSFNITIPKNILVEFPNLEAFPSYSNQYKVGKSIFTKKTLKSLGVDPTTGLYKFEDVNGDGNISTYDDGQFLKQVAQDFYGGINNSFTYKGFQLDVFFQFVKQTGYNYLSSFGSPGSLSNQPTIVLNRWQETGNITDIQRYSLVGNGSAAYLNNRFSDKAISDASFIKLKNVSLSWQLPAKWIKKARLENSRIYIQGQNLLTITNYLGMDPENQNINFLPPLRMLTMGIQITL